MKNKINPSSDIVLREEGEEAFLFNPASNNIKVLNNTGAFIWKLCDGKHSRDDIVNALTEEFNVPSQEEAEKDLAKFLETLQNGGFINA
ncbi:PqqD family protein [bacterium]|nr:MAG: PqqD family protein [bacterium]